MCQYKYRVLICTNASKHTMHSLTFAQHTHTYYHTAWCWYFRSTTSLDWALELSLGFTPGIALSFQSLLVARWWIWWPEVPASSRVIIWVHWAKVRECMVCLKALVHMSTLYLYWHMNQSHDFIYCNNQSTKSCDCSFTLSSLLFNSRQQTVPMIVLYVSCDCTTKNGSYVNQLCRQHNMMSEHII